MVSIDIPRTNRRFVIGNPRYYGMRFMENFRYLMPRTWRDARVTRAYPRLFGGERDRILRNMATARLYAAMLGPYEP